MKRSFLFLQGPSTPFFWQLAKRLLSLGHAVHRINFCAGDALFWPHRATRYSVQLAGLPAFLDEIYSRYGITDQILFGDRRPVHRPAIDHGQACDIRTHVFEEGYFRPWWITLEREGVNGHSLLPRDPDWFRQEGKRLIDDNSATAFTSPFFMRAYYDVLYHLAGAANPVFFPDYRNHAGISAPIEYAGYVRRFSWLRLHGANERQRAMTIAKKRGKFYLLPLQLNTDAQIRDHSSFEHMGEVIDYVLASFARNAPTDCRIVIKNHPLDIGLMNYAAIIRECETRYGLAGRIEYLEDGDLLALAMNARGVVTVNSTVGIISLEQNIPTTTLSDPIYNLPGLTAQIPLDQFWQHGEVPDEMLFRCFRRCVMKATQINGGFYSNPGLTLAVENSAQVLTAKLSPLELMTC